MPPHTVYIEAFLGGGAVLRNKRPAARNIGIEIDPKIALSWTRGLHSGVEVYNADALSYLATYPFEGQELIYCDPPYLRETRRRQKSLYRFEYSRSDHQRLLNFLRSLSCRVLISGYRSTLYDDFLKDWISIDFQGDSHAGPRTETIWMNFNPPEILHDYRYLGASFRDRESIRRRRDALARKVEALPEIERNAFLSYMTEIYRNRGHSSTHEPSHTFGAEDARP